MERLSDAGFAQTRAMALDSAFGIAQMHGGRSGVATGITRPPQDCPECDGRGAVSLDPETEYRCGLCKGSGKIPAAYVPTPVEAYRRQTTAEEFDAAFWGGN